jgi:hypothetical protein
MHTQTQAHTHSFTRTHSLLFFFCFFFTFFFWCVSLANTSILAGLGVLCSYCGGVPISTVDAAPSTHRAPSHAEARALVTALADKRTATQTKDAETARRKQERIDARLAAKGTDRDIAASIASKVNPPPAPAPQVLVQKFDFSLFPPFF